MATDRVAAADILVAHAAQLPPPELGRAGRALVEALTRTPSVDDPADEAALQREQERAEAAAQAAERNELVVRQRPSGRSSSRLELGPLGTAALLAWLRAADKAHPGSDGCADDRSREQRRGDRLVDLLGNPDADTSTSSGSDEVELSDPVSDGCATTRRAPPAAGILLTVSTTLDGLRAGLAGAGCSTPASASAPPTCACSPATARSCRLCSTARRRSSTSVAPLAPGPLLSVARWPCAMAPAARLAATVRRPHATCTTCSTGPTAAPPTVTTAHSPAASTTGWSTAGLAGHAGRQRLSLLRSAALDRCGATPSTAPPLPTTADPCGRRP